MSLCAAAAAQIGELLQELLCCEDVCRAIRDVLRDQLFLEKQNQKQKTKLASKYIRIGRVQK